MTPVRTKPRDAMRRGAAIPRFRRNRPCLAELLNVPAAQTFSMSARRARSASPEQRTGRT
jgi:hypothetical protein